MVEVSTFEHNVQLHLTPNRSASWQQTKHLILVFALFISGIAIAWSLVGVWIILPFAGLEVGLLALIMHLVSKSTYQWESVAVSYRSISVRCSNGALLVFSRQGTSLYFIEDLGKQRLPRVLLKSDYQQCELGAFLNADDKQRLHLSLKQAGVMVCTNRWW
ncbi:DUF2244 domain-containing protein [Alteromonas sp. ALT199]|uniref:DUF2244 domain-containing protein n=1 Tax=unclassified Alteromonas TaxID=2614992 RepID=UPI00044861B2|nr:DUF2244 domain-containing protein [Alteromonas sp. ALT199]MBT3134964.1 DUF2244 domain-containing protein [Alteromonas sp. ALT199]